MSVRCTASAVVGLVAIAAASPGRTADTADDALARYKALTGATAQAQACGASGGADEIVVCARRSDDARYRVPSSAPAAGARGTLGSVQERADLFEANGPCAAIRARQTVPCGAEVDLGPVATALKNAFEKLTDDE